MAFIRVLAMALPVLLLLLANTARSSPHPSGSVRDQYEAREDQQLISEATDHHQSPEAAPFETVRTRREASVKKKRSYYPWAPANQVVYQQAEPYQSIQVWRAPTYQITRPYYIPVYGSPGRIPIYFPPQPLYHNQGQPADNRKPFRGPTYLPPVSKPTPTPDPDMMPINTTVDYRFGETTPNPPQQMFTDDDNEQRPIWADVGFTRRPTGGSRRTTTMSPARRPGTTTTPPSLVHSPRNISSAADSNIASGSDGGPPANNVRTTRRPQAVRPPPAGQSGAGIGGGWRPTPPPLQDPVAGPTNCVWAIIACCPPNGIADIPYDCFEQRSCSGSFWGDNPCNSDFARAAIANAFNYYETKK